MRRLAHALAAATLLCASSAWAAELRGGQKVEFPVRSAAGEERLFGYLYLPPGRESSRSPAVVIVHGSGGVREGREGFWADELSRSGYGVLVVDSFTPRGVGSTVEDQSRVSTAQMVRDAFGALAFLASHPAIDAGKVAVMGMSKGGAVALQAADERDIKAAGLAFAAHIPLYPGCTTQYRHPRMHAPILMLIGGKDDYTGVKPCADYAERIRAGGAPVQLTVYPGATHGFDGDIGTSRDLWLPRAQNYRDCVVLLEDDGGATLANTGEPLDIRDAGKAIAVLARVCMRHGATVGFYPHARKQALEDVKAFLSIHLTTRSKT